VLRTARSYKVSNIDIHTYICICICIFTCIHTSAGTELVENCSCISNFYKSDDLLQCYVCPAQSESVSGLCIRMYVCDLKEDVALVPVCMHVCMHACMYACMQANSLMLFAVSSLYVYVCMQVSIYIGT
jgi:hypothetical protein